VVGSSAVLGELEGRRLQVNARATHQRDELGDEVGVEAARPSHSRCGRHVGPAAHYRRGDAPRRAFRTGYTSTKTKANPMIGKPMRITLLHVAANLRRRHDTSVT
jgi:hypothetical protein